MELRRAASDFADDHVALLRVDQQGRRDRRGRGVHRQLDGKLVALDQWTEREVCERQLGRWQEGYTITSAPLYYDGRVYSGISGGEYGIRGRL